MAFPCLVVCPEHAPALLASVGYDAQNVPPKRRCLLSATILIGYGTVVTSSLNSHPMQQASPIFFKGSCWDLAKLQNELVLVVELHVNVKSGS